MNTSGAGSSGTPSERDPPCPTPPAGSPTPPTVLIVEDDPAYSRLLVEAFHDAACATCVVTVPSGEAAMRFLRHEGAFRDAATPGLVLLDLNLPGIDGQQVLKAIRQDAALAKLPVVVLTGSPGSRRAETMKDLAANAVILKPYGFHDLASGVDGTAYVWLCKGKAGPA